MQDSIIRLDLHQISTAGEAFQSDMQQRTKGLSCTDPSHETKITFEQGAQLGVSYGNMGDFPLLGRVKWP